MTNLEDMSPFEHRGVTYFADDMERIYDAEGKLLGYICSRGAQYAWGALRPDDSEFARGNGVWTEFGPDANDPAMDAILAAHSEREDALEGRR